ncbi:MAG: TetR/AcrR family transcriptional regulator [Clostridia bacterium]|nr:TetR/AcrR family transcriptional regulator [Clostridia bacterium]
MWISKEAEVRKKEILDAALELFYEIGYDKTSINDVINRVGVTKGSFYYHFKSKDEILETIALQQAEEMVAVFGKAAGENNKNSLEKINIIISDMQQYRAETKEKRFKLFEILNKSENLKLKQKVFENYMRLGKPIIGEIIEQGIKEGTFATDFSDELAEFYIHFFIIVHGTINMLIRALDEKPENIEIIKRKVSFYEEMFEKILGVKKGSINFAEPVLKILNYTKG